jgi:NIMA (never in mitosis gene a)-related kinase
MCDNFEFIKELGSGSFSKVFLVKRIDDGEMYAMKKVKMAALSRREKENALNEIRILASVDHKNVIAYKEAFFEEDEGALCIVMEMADSGDLDSKIEQAKKIKSFIKENKIWYIFK